MPYSEPTTSVSTFRCTNCGYGVQVQTVQSLPHCPNCSGPQYWELLGRSQRSRTSH